MTNSKQWWKSKLMWSGITALMVSIGMVVTGEFTWAEAMLGVEGFAVVLLRLITSQAIE